MTDIASRTETTPAVATLTMPDAAEGIATTDASAPSPPSWSWPASAPDAAPPADAATNVTHLAPESSSADAEVMVVGEAAVAEPRMPAKSMSFGPVGKHRSPLAVVALSVVTLGLYTLVWHHRINREVGNFDTRMHVVPGRSTLAVTIPWVLGWLVSIAGAARIVLAVMNVTLPFDPHFTVLQAYGLLGGGLIIPYLELLLPFSAAAWVMTLERVRIVEDRIGRTTDVQLRPARTIFWMLLPVIGGLVLVATMQRRLNRVWQDDKAIAPLPRPAVKSAAL